MVAGCVVFTCQLLANPITREQAQRNVQAFLQQRGKRVAAPSLHHAQMTSSPSAAYYVFNVGNDDGYVIASGDDCVPDILGYADEGTIDINNIPCNMQGWLDGYAQQIQSMREKGVSASRAPRRLSAMPAVDPLLMSQWNQTYPYYLSCPLDTNGRRCYTGCVATAMAQVLYYHRERSVSQTTHEMAGYVTERGVSVEAVPAGSFIDWDNMVDRYAGTTTTDEQKAAVANLMKYCGTAVQMDYTSSSSGAFTPSVAYAMVAFFNYSSKTKYMDRNDSGLTDDEWEQLIYDELSHSRPVLYSGWSDNAGHAFVCDGYDGDGYFHINWGWGASQGYYLLTAIDDAGSSLINYNQSQEAVIHAEPRAVLPSPDEGIQFADPIAAAVSLEWADTNDDGVLTVEEAAAITTVCPLTAAYMSSFDEFRYFTGVTSLCDWMFTECNKMKSIVLHDNVTSIGEGAFKNCDLLAEITIPCSVTHIGNMALTQCPSLKRITWNARNCAPTVTPIVNGAVEHVTIGDSVEVIPNNFAKNAKIKDVTIGKSVNKIGASAFYNCTRLKSVVFPNSLETINQKAFYGSTALERVEFGKGLKLVNDNSFSDCSSLHHVTIPDSVTKIGMNAFNGCTSLESVTIGRSVTTIGSSAFSGCSSLRTVTSLAPEPSPVNSNAFKGVYGQAVLRVPAGSLEAYQATAPWNQFSAIVAIDVSQGDVNLDGTTDIADLVYLIDLILESASIDYGDVNDDGAVDIGDVVDLIEKILSWQD